jgi:plasmid maintenance system antidote protein VapI
VPSPPRHPLEEAIFSTWCRQNGLDPAQLRRWMAGTEQVSREVAEGLRAVLGVPLASWPLLEPKFGLVRPTSKQTLHERVQSVNDVRMSQATNASDSRPGRRAERTSEIREYADKLGISMSALAKRLKVPRTTLLSWHERGIPDAERHRLKQ